MGILTELAVNQKNAQLAEQYKQLQLQQQFKSIYDKGQEVGAIATLQSLQQDLQQYPTRHTQENVNKSSFDNLINKGFTI